MSDIPFRAGRVDPIDRQTRKIIEDAERGAAMLDGDLTNFARVILAGRKQRERYFDPALFSNPAWDILLSLFVADADGQSLTILEGCLASPLPQGVALRWLDYLRQEDMVVERPDPAQPRQTLIGLSDHARLSVGAYLGSLTTLGLAIDPLAQPLTRN